MTSFILRRLTALVFVLLAVVSLTFFLIRLAPGGPFDRERSLPPQIEQQLLAKYKLDGPEGRAIGDNLATRMGLGEKGRERLGETFSLGQQYFSYMGDLLRGDLRMSTQYRNRTVNELLAQALPVSFTLGCLAFIIAVSAGLLLGIYAALRHNTRGDRLAMLFALLAISLPTFVTGPLLILFFGIMLGWLPVGGWGSPQAMLLPALTLAAPFVAYIARLTRTSVLETLGNDFVRTARAKGLPERLVIGRHVMKVAILPVVTFMGPLAAHLLTGSIVVESVFNIPGAGSFFVNSIFNRDGFLLGGVVIVYCTLLVLFNLVVDLSYHLLDRRVRLDT